MKRPVTVVAALALLAGSFLSMSSSASADEATTILTAIRWGGPVDKGDPVVTSLVKKRIFAAYGTALTPTIACTGPECDPARPARIEILTNGTWKTWATGTLAQLTDTTKSLIYKRTTSVLVRSTLPAHGDMPAVTSARWTVRFLPGTSVTVTGPTVIRPTAANDYQWQFRPGPGSITVTLSPAEAGRAVEIRDSLVEGYPLIAKATTDARGVATVTGDFTDVRSLAISVPPTRTRAGWQTFAAPLS